MSKNKMSLIDEILSRALAAPKNIPVAMLASALGCDDSGVWRELRAAAYELKTRLVGRKVNLRGLVECSNICAKDCLYCGIRKNNQAVLRYRMDADEIVECCRNAEEWGYGSVALQAGEIESDANTSFYENILGRMPSTLGVTLSLGEQTRKVFERWRNAGAHRYLLRIETSNPKLYSSLHPADHSWQRRRACLADLRDLDYQVGTGVMIGLPGQTALDLANDISFFGEIDADMIGMGPWIPCATALISSANWDSKSVLELGLRMIALTRLYLWDVNIAATTALQTLAEDGREQGILSGANVIMPNITPARYRDGYQLYANKPNDDENGLGARRRLEKSIVEIGETMNMGSQGNSLHYQTRVKSR